MRFKLQSIPRKRGALLVLAASLVAGAAAAQAPAIERVPPGQTFPGAVFDLFNPQGKSATIDLTPMIGAKPIVLYYWVPGNPRADTVFGELLEKTREIGSDKLAVYGVAVPNPGYGLTADVVRDKIEALGIDVPVLHDEGFVIGRLVGIRSVPNITIIDRSGKLRLSNGASVHQLLEYKVDLAAALQRLARTGEIVTYGYLDRYFPVKELEGKPAPDFKAQLLVSSVEQSLRGLIARDKVNVLIFWSVDCPHCRESLPEINGWLRDNPEGLNVVSCATVTNETAKVKTKEFCETNGFGFPTLVDQDAEIGQLYMVTSTPTIVIIRPDGVIDSAVTSAYTDFGSMMERKKKELL